MRDCFNNIVIAGIQAAVPFDVKDNTDYTDVLGNRRCNRQIQLTGVSRRHISPKEQNSADLAYVAGKKLLERLEWNPKEVDVLIFATQNPSFVLPSTAFFLQKKLGIKKDCVVFDINLGCPSAIIGIKLVASLLNQAGTNARGLLLISDAVHEVEKREEFTPDDLLFGSAGAAIALQRSEQLSMGLDISNQSDGSRYRVIIREWGKKFTMDGEAVFSFAINDIVKDVNMILSSLRETGVQIDYYVFHQAQALILNTIDETCGIPREQEFRSLSEYGNTRGASIFVSMCQHCVELQKKKRAKIFLCSFGGGLAWGSIITEIETSKIFPIVFENSHYEE